MSSAAEILVIIISIFLGFFLVLGVALVIYLIVLTRQIRRVTKSAERTADHIEAAVAGAAKMASPLFFLNIVKKWASNLKDKRGGSDDDKR